MTNDHPASTSPRTARRLAADQRALEGDQTLSDSDQTQADVDQTTSEADGARAAADQVAADLDQDAADIDHAERASSKHAAVDPDGASAEDLRDAEYESTRAKRRTSTVVRFATALARADAATIRDENAAHRDRIACERDVAAAALDAEIEALEVILDRTLAQSPSPLKRFRELCRLSGEVRVRAAADRARAAVEREDAADFREGAVAELRAAHLDDLTGAYRRGMGRRALGLEIERAQRGDGRLMVAFVDIDDMKGVNDRAGHTAGDDVLRAVVDTVRSHVRPYDPIVRWGGDEFVVALGGAGREEVAHRFQAIRQALSEHQPTTISVGLAEWDGHESIDQLVDRSDAALLVERPRFRSW